MDCGIHAVVHLYVPTAAGLDAKHWFTTSTAIIVYAIGLRKLSANGQFFVGAQMAVSLYQATQIISGVSFITAHIALASINNTKIL